MRDDEESGRRRAPGRWEPADDGERRRWHGDSEERHGGRGRSRGVWRPSPGSIYPALQQLEDEGLIRAEAGDGGRRAYQLTDEGRAYAQAHPDELNAPWDVVAGGAGGAAIEMRGLIGQVAMAA